MHYKRLLRRGDVEFGRPADWGRRANHPLMDSWAHMGRSGGRDAQWEDFWVFVADVGEKPSPKHQLRRQDFKKPWGQSNWYWCEPLSDEGKPEGKVARAAYAKKWRAKNPMLAKASYLKTRFGITLGDYDRMLAEQDGGCAICGRADPNFSLAVDHCHKTKRVRQLLCTKCNQGLGHFRDDPALLLRAIEYLARHAEPIAA